MLEDGQQEPRLGVGCGDGDVLAGGSYPALLDGHVLASVQSDARDFEILDADVLDVDVAVVVSVDPVVGRFAQNPIDDPHRRGRVQFVAEMGWAL
ncbi:MAG: hypothetical protein CMF52_00035 [Legionellales bacterium]|nr:hypothetical protein [Legionellales bacterium]